MQNIDIKEYLISLEGRRERKAERVCGGPVLAQKTICGKVNLILVEGLGILNTIYTLRCRPTQSEVKSIFVFFSEWILEPGVVCLFVFSHS